MARTITIADTGIEDPILKEWGGITDLSDAVLDDPAIQAADAAAAQRFVETGEPVDLAVRIRVYARVARGREEDFRKHGYIDCSQFWIPSTDDE
jgi:hypothetical protein